MRMIDDWWCRCCFALWQKISSDRINDDDLKQSLLNLYSNLCFVLISPTLAWRIGNAEIRSFPPKNNVIDLKKNRLLSWKISKHCIYCLNFGSVLYTFHWFPNMLIFLYLIDHILRTCLYSWKQNLTKNSLFC